MVGEVVGGGEGGGLIERVRQSLKRLTEIALKPNPLTEIEYLDLLISFSARSQKLSQATSGV